MNLDELECETVDNYITICRDCGKWFYLNEEYPDDNEASTRNYEVHCFACRNWWIGFENQ